MKLYTIRLQCLVACTVSISVTSCISWNAATSPFVPEERQKENKLYHPSALYAPMLNEKHDIDASLLQSFQSGAKAIDLQAAYMPLKHLGTTISYTQSTGGNSNFDRVEIGAGYVGKFTKTSGFEIYGGFGIGNIFNEHQTGASYINQSLFYIQPTYSLNTESNNLQIAFVSRFTRVNYDVEVTTFSYNAEPYSRKQIENLQQHPFHVIWEPGVTLRNGWKNFQFKLTYATATDFTNRDLNIVKSNFSIGASVRFNAGKRKNS